MQSLPLTWSPRVLSGILLSAFVLGESFAQTPAPASSPSRTLGDVVKLDTLQVTGSSLRSQEAVNNRRESLGVVDTLTQDDIGALADENLADAMIRMAGVSTMQTLYGEQEASYVSTRGISPDLNFVSFDGIEMFSTASDGDGLRRVDLNLIPTQISRTTSVYKTFTADLDAGAIGGLTNIEPYSALNGRQTMYLDAQATVQTGTGKYIPAANSRGHYKDDRVGPGLKGLWVKRFGARGQFGLVLSGMFRERNFDYTKRNPNGIAFFTPTGAAASTSLSNWDGLQPFPTLFRPMDYTHYTETHGGSVQFEYRISETWQASIMGFGYKQTEDQNLNQFYLDTFTGLTRPSAELGRFKIGRVRPSYSYDRFEQETRGLIVKAVGKFSSDASLELRAGKYINRFYDLDYDLTYAYSPTASFATFDMTRIVDKITIENNDPLIAPANYRLNAAADNIVDAKVESTEGRIDFKKNYRTNGAGFGFAAGGDLRETKDKRDGAVITYTTNNSALGDIGFVPGFLSQNYGYPTLWLNYDKFATQVKPGLAINKNNSNNNSWLSDYYYTEHVAAAYLSLKYGAEKTQYLAGVRYDQVDFNARSPLDTTGLFDGAFTHYTGGYDHLLPSASLIHSFTPGLRLKASVSKSLGRPQFGDIAQAERRDNTALTITRGNPQLKPRRADNYDLALEYYFSRSGLVSVSAFSKDVKDDIYTQSADEAIDGVTYTVSTPRNSSSSKMRGAEVQLIHDALPGLPGFLEKRVGVSLNYTKLWGEMNYLSGSTYVHLKSLQYQPDWLANATVFYTLPHQKGEFRVSYNWTGKSPVSLGAFPWTTYWLNERERLDVAIRYSITKRFIVKLQGSNVTRQGVSQAYITPYPMNRYEMTGARTFTLDFVFKL